MFLSFKGMYAVQSAQRNSVQDCTSASHIVLEEYCAVDYLEKDMYYIRRALSIANQLVKFKFLHRVYVMSATQIKCFLPRMLY